MLRSQRAPGPVPEIVSCGDDAEEATTIVTRITQLIASGIPARDIAILMRTNATSAPFEAALAEANVGYVMRGAERFFERPEVREAIVRMRGHAVAGARGGAQAASDVDGLVEQAEDVLAGMGWLSTGPASGGATRERWESLAALLGLAREVAASGRSTMAELVEEFERRAQLSHAPTPDGVTVTTLHSAKGLEWPVVFIVGAAEGGLPIVYADTPERIEEERRLFYVGVTRARDQLVISWALTRPGSSRYRQASRFLAAVRVRGEVTVDSSTSGLVRRGRSGAPEKAPRKAPARCRVCNARLISGDELTLGRCGKCPGNADAGVAQRLRDWRAATAKEQGITEGMVLRDLTLQAIAERRPATESDLGDIPEFRPDKRARYGPDILALVAATEPSTRPS